MKIAILIPYFGKWPEWIELYFFSCRKNESIDWFFFTDCEIPKVYGNNIHFYSITFDEYCKEVSRKLNIEFHPQKPYKLCGLRPFYGFLYKELLEGFDFWGYGDVDVVWGNIRKFYTDELLKKYDVFSTQADRVSGHLALYRNERKYTGLCFKIPNWQEKLLSERMYPLDEVDIARILYPASWYIQKMYSKVTRKVFNWRNAWVIHYRLMPVINFVLHTKKKKLYFKEQHTTPILYNDGLTFKHDSDRWLYKDGKVINMKNEKEYIYFHFMIFKKNGFRNDHFWTSRFYHVKRGYDLNNGILIDKQGFHEL